MARVTYNSTGGKSPEVAILPNATGGTQRRNVLLNSGSSSNKGDNIFVIEEGQLRKKNKCYWMNKQLLHTLSQLLSLTVAILPNATGGTQRRNVLLNRGSSSNKGDNIFVIEEGQLRKKNKCYWMNKQLLHTLSQLLSLMVFSWLSYILHEQVTSYYLLSVKFLSLTVSVVNPFAPHQVSSLGLGSSMSNTSLLKGSDAWVRKWASGTAYNHTWRSWYSLTTCLQMAWIDSPRFLKERCRAY